MFKIVSAEQAVEYIHDGDCIGVKIKDDRLKMFDCVAGEAIK